MRLQDKVAIVTGSGRSIGREIALRFAAEGATTVIADINLQNARAVAAEIDAAGGRALPLAVDVTDASQATCLADEVVAAFGCIDILVNNAGVGLNKPFLQTTPEEWERTIRVNLTGTFLCGHAVACVMSGQGFGRIINIASISGQRGAQGRSAYGASKAGVILLTKVMALELAVKGIRVNAIAPGPVVTAMTNVTHTAAVRRSYHRSIPMKRYAEASEIAAAAVFLASDEASFIDGHVLNVDGGFQAAGLMFDAESGTA
jgi:3-oxoacyl-[acyl-carrier protein] reductase